MSDNPITGKPETNTLFMFIMDTVFVNCTPHPIKLNDGTVYAVTDSVARVSSSFTDFTDNVCKVVYGATTGVPAPKANTKYIVSAMVLAASDRDDLVAPATGHKDCVRDGKGFIVSVPGFVSK